MSASDTVGLVWFRSDLRLDDNPAWAAATAGHGSVVALYVIDPRLLAGLGPYRRRQLVANVQALDFELFERTGGRLHVRVGDPVVVVPAAARDFTVGAVHWNDEVDPALRRRDATVRGWLPVSVRSWWSGMVLPPGAIGGGGVPRTFGAFHAAWLDTPWDRWPEAGSAAVYDEPGAPLPCLDGPPLLVEGTAGARDRLARVVRRLDAHPDRAHVFDGGGALSVDLRDGTISARALVTAVAGDTPARLAAVRHLVRRDWHAHRLVADPSLVLRAGNPSARAVVWEDDALRLSAWKGGFTGFPIIDAGMRELRLTGWMPHRVRTAVAAFFAHGLLLDWRAGERHVRHLLVDGDIADEVGRWQEAAGVAVHGTRRRAANPVTEGRVIDPDGHYVRRWVPELAKLDTDHVHSPWSAPTEALARAGIELGRDYPNPIVDLGDTRRRYVEMMRAAARAAATAPVDERVAAIDLTGGGPSGRAHRARSATPALTPLPKRNRSVAAPRAVPGGAQIIDLTGAGEQRQAERRDASLASERRHA